MIRLYRALAAAVAITLTFSTGGTAMAQAAPVTAASLTQANEVRADVGDRWQEILPTGETLMMEKVAPGVSRSLTPVARTPGQCSIFGYLCAWSGDNQNGTFWRYNMNNVYANTANGVAHCWNMAPDANNNTKSWMNMSDRIARLRNWVNCNANGEYFRLDPRRFVRCMDVIDWPGDWCNVLRPTSISAAA